LCTCSKFSMLILVLHTLAADASCFTYILLFQTLMGQH
jgi:hypothetical protein